MALTDSKLNSITTGYSIRFRDALTRMTGELGLGMLADIVTSTTKTMNYPIRGRTAGMREWNGSRVVREYQVYGYSLASKTFEDTVKVKVEDMEDDLYGLYDSAFTDLGEAGARLPFDQVVAAIKAGGTALGYDDVSFFNDAHPKDPFKPAAGTVDNLFASTALTASNLHTVMTAMRTRSDEHGQLLRVTPTHLVIPAALEKTADEILGGDLITQTMTSPGNLAVATSNMMRGRVQKLVLPELDADSATTWYLLDLSKPAKPFFWQWRTQPNLTRTAPDSDYVRENRAHLFTADARGAAGYGLWQLASKCTA